MSFRSSVIAGIYQQLTIAGEALIVSRGGQSVSVLGIYGNPNRNVSQGEAVVLSDETSFIIRRDEYKPTGEVSDPRIGDRIERESTEMYEVIRPSSGLNHCDDFGGVGYAWRVQAVRIRT